MQRRSVSRLEPGMCLAVDVLRNDGVLLLKAGVPLSEQQIQSLDGVVHAVYVRREGFDDVLSRAVVPDETARFDLVRRLEGIYCFLYEKYVERADRGERERIAPPRGAGGGAVEFRDLMQVDQALRHCARSILEDVRDRRYALLSFDLPAPKHNSLYVFEHAVQSAILAARVLENSYREGSFHYVEDRGGHREHREHPFDEKRFEDLLAGILLCEGGMLSIPREVLAVPIFSPEDRAKYLYPHPRVSREMARLLPSLSPLAGAVVANHHERRDGQGYPRGSTDHHPFVDAAILATTFDALVSSRPQRPGMGTAKDDKACHPAEALERLFALAAEGAVHGGILEELARYVVPYPFGTTLVLSNGDVGLVVDCTDRVDPARRQRPLVRCSQNIRTGRREGLWEVDLASRTDLTVQSAIYA
ncbi:putative metal dependent phosphohydrolase [Aminomonas paucivorans DSM 12260]|uniref:Putative metal dependent phosphohydrolase n=1 Tax=Aminomonas paucivorans DSM 12260 TaxID=584708 RepID=E3CV12_9BACT|nr:HD domain-containing phosphohydrolase [Aminomonas paucivorans]EFQ23169.1 putative metal dependent phosphohydrolase [Aminomonas paucivorans DSM 12260]